MLSGIILAAGESTRMGGIIKQLLKLGDKNFIETIAEKMLAAGTDEVVVVLGANSETILKNSNLNNLKVVINFNYREGQLSSLRVGLKCLDAKSEAFFLNPCDCPTVRTKTYELLKEKWSLRKECIHIPRYRGKNGHPAVFPSVFYNELLSGMLKDGAKSVIRNNKDSVCYVDVDDEGVVADIDTSEDFNELLF